MMNARRKEEECTGTAKRLEPHESTIPFAIPGGCMILLSLVTVAYAGGWDLVTVKDFPDFVVAGKTLELTFTVWVPSLAPLNGLHPVVPATDPKGSAVRAIAKAGAATGEYTAALVLPEPGEWVIAIDTEYESAATLSPLKVIAPGTTAPNHLHSQPAAFASSR
jgi:hypothetical protein